MEWIRNRILQLLGSAAKVIFVIMFLLTSVSSQSSCISKPIKTKTIYNELAHQFLAVRNGTVATIDNQRTLYIITVYMTSDSHRDHRYSSKFFIYDPVENRFICLKKHRFVAKKKLPKQEDLCMFLEEPSDYTVRYVVKFEGHQYALKFNKKGKLMPTRKSNRKSELFISKLIVPDCYNATTEFCNNLSTKRHHKNSKTIGYICSRN